MNQCHAAVLGWCSCARGLLQVSSTARMGMALSLTTRRDRRELMGGGEPRGRAHGAGAGSDDELAPRQDACIFATSWASYHPARARHTAPGAACQAAAGILGYSSESFSLPAVVRTRSFAGVQAASAPAFPANPNCVPSAGLLRVNVRCYSVTSGTDVLPSFGACTTT